MACLREYRYEILLKNTTLKECEDYIKKCSEDVYLVPGGYKVKGITLLGMASPVGFSGSDIIIQFTKPCFGFFVIKLENEAQEVKKLRDQYKKDKNVKKIK
ncbi:MAG: DUF1894 domain-containing protein [Methanosarcina sp.]|jgi:hypothetical protein|nr:DUF1894 domain-containing protein [Methanosarcina sp.]MDD3873335.1 DUF1894 domain-containing protein [Methanosarcina sp.]MDD4523094.1 DUF1894 domain-containing protein [Methanosarcina sp.]HHV24291.1 DUF1894 domain-containing protein [Methanosarcina sp.]